MASEHPENTVSPEQELNRSLIGLLVPLAKTLNAKGYETLKSEGGRITLFNGQSRLAEISPTSISLADQLIMDTNLIQFGEQSKTLNPKTFEEFLAEIKLRIIRLNHLGVSYFCPNIEDEVKKYQNLALETGFKFYEENYGSYPERWFYLGNTSNLDPLFEIVLEENKDKRVDSHRPHFQIDLDTDLTIEELETLTEKHFGKDFFSWKYPIPNYGVVMGMGELGEISGTKIFLGLGTKLRLTRFHREQILKEV